MALSSDEMNAIKLRELGGETAAKAWNDAMNALHAYAQASECPLGVDVIQWFESARDGYSAALSDAINKSMAGDRS